MLPTLKACFHALLLCLILNEAFAAKPQAKIRLEDIENDNNKRVQELKAQEASAKQSQAAPQGGLLPHQYFQFGQQPAVDYGAALQGAVHPQLYLGQRDQLALLEALGQHPGFSVAPFHGLYGNAASQGIPNTGAFPIGHFRTGAVPPTPSGAYSLSPSAYYGQSERPQAVAKLAPQQALAPQLQYQQQIQQLQQQAVQQLTKAQPQLAQQYQQQIAQPQFVYAAPSKQEAPQQVAIPQKNAAPQQQFFQLPQYVQQLTQHPQYLQQIQAIQQQAQAQLSSLQESPKFQPSPELRQGHAGSSQQYFQPASQPIQQPDRQQYLQSTAQPYLQQAQQQLIQAVPHQYLQHQYLQPGQQHYLQAAQQELLDSRAVYQQPYLYQGGAAVGGQIQKAAVQSIPAGNQVIVGVGGNQLSSKQAALAVKREGSRGGVRPIGAVSAFARGGYTS